MVKSLKLLISPINEEEALEAIRGGADIIDVKNPKEGSLGANFPWMIRKISELLPANIELSATIGDVPYLPGTVSLAALGAAVSGANYIKVGLFGVRKFENSVYLMKKVCKSVKDYDDSIKVVVAGYADADRISAINPLLIPKVAIESSCDIAMIDTFDKRGGKRLFDFLTDNQLEKFVMETHDHNLMAALAGSILISDIPRIYYLGADVVGIRGAACEGDRLTGKITENKVKILSKMIQDLNKNKPQALKVKT